MSNILPPATKIWWNEPVHRSELIWISLVFVWGVIMTFMMPYWHIVGKQNLGTETYKSTAAQFQPKVQEFVDKFTVRHEGPRNYPVVAPPAGGDVYMLARLWEWWPILELKKGETYRFHLSSLDWQHGFSLQPANINIQVVPDHEHVFSLTPNAAGEYSVICNEFCGLGHHLMIGKILVVE